jgi:6-phospho-beta-glucosidase
VAAALDVDLAQLHLEYAGLNHLGWLTGVWLDGHDVLPQLLAGPGLQRVEEAVMFGCDEVRALGAIPNEYLYFYERAPAAVRNIRNGGAPRGEFLDGQDRSLSRRIDAATDPAGALAVYRSSLQVRNDTYMAVEARIERAPIEDVFASAGGYHEVALSVVEAIGLDRVRVLIVNTPNRGVLPFLEADDVIEVTSVVRRAGVFPLVARVPSERRGLIKSVKSFERSTLAALARGSIAEARNALALHPLVPSRDVAAAIFDEYASAMPAVAAGFGAA